MMLLFCGVVLFLIIGSVRMLARSGRVCYGHGQSSHALDILNERYAKGEIAKEEYESKKKDILAIQ
jgi:putative membrane protein